MVFSISLVFILLFLLQEIAESALVKDENETAHNHDHLRRDAHHLVQYRTNATSFCDFANESHHKPRCVHNDSYCGDWVGRDWNSIGCKYRDITNAEARKCMGSRTLAFVGDSQIRDLGAAVGFFLAGQTVGNASDEKYDKKGLNSLGDIGERIGYLDRWKGTNVKEGEDYNGVIFPSKKLRKKEGWDWQIQVWELYSNYHINGKDTSGKFRHVEDILSNNMVNETLGSKSVDFAFWSHGLHDHGWWSRPPYYKMYMEQMVGNWLQIREKMPVPTVWVSMNNNCPDLIVHTLIQSKEKQNEMMEYANYHVLKMMRHQKLPYFDAASVLRTPKRCEASSDGLHLKMWVDIVRAKILFNHLCDENMNWVGDLNRFT